MKMLSVALVLVLIGPSLGQEPQPRATLRADKDVTLTIAFSPDGKLLATGGGDGKAKFWDVGTGKLRATLKGHEGRTFPSLTLMTAPCWPQPLKIRPCVSGRSPRGDNRPSYGQRALRWRSHSRPTAILSYRVAMAKT